MASFKRGDVNDVQITDALQFMLSNIIRCQIHFRCCESSDRFCDNLHKLEEYLDTDRSMSFAIKEIATSGWKNVYDLVYRATQKLVTNKFAAGYSYFGQGKKLKFS
ncbi:hypothetical protein RN001_005203 [Aquatica leii]|uniref:Uncharacterized protein n=1 Tax=Aquatica leii TaxID=1421715 RepID=A0AAN7Q068_9COLE|nr:hypothetical protein RN001_005203 [Aquatica leii]